MVVVVVLAVVGKGVARKIADGQDTGEGMVYDEKDERQQEGSNGSGNLDTKTGESRVESREWEVERLRW